MKIALRQERMKYGWKQEYVAQKCGVSPQAVCDWENNRRKPSYNVLVKLEDLFGMSHRELFAVADETVKQTEDVAREETEKTVKNRRRSIH